MPTVAEQLQAARESRGLSVQQVADLTKIRTDHIRALDEGNYKAFPAPVYIRGFVRTYAGHLKLDVAKIITQLNEELGDAGMAGQLPPAAGPARGALDMLTWALAKVNWRLVLPLLALLLLAGGGVLGYRAWVSYQSRNPLEGLSSGQYRPAPDGGDTLPLPKPRR